MAASSKFIRQFSFNSKVRIIFISSKKSKRQHSLVVRRRSWRVNVDMMPLACDDTYSTLPPQASHTTPCIAWQTNRALRHAYFSSFRKTLFSTSYSHLYWKENFLKRFLKLNFCVQLQNIMQNKNLEISFIYFYVTLTSVFVGYVERFLFTIYCSAKLVLLT